MEENKEKNKNKMMMKKKKEKKSSVNGDLLSPIKFKETKNGRNRKQKKPVEDNKEVGESEEEPPLGYIHVRARRGQATDSHSLAERVRREKISERMKVLQGLVPGCEKVVGKALMLDEIINYVQSLQNQVEFLSMKLACANPVLFDSVDYDCLVNQTEFEVVGSMPQASQPLPSSLHQASIIQQPTGLDHGTAKAYEALLINSPQTLLQSQGPIPLAQENGSLFMQVGDQSSQELLNYMVLSNMCSFQ